MAANNQSELKIGQEIAPGVIYGGISDTTGTRMFVMKMNIGAMPYENVLDYTLHICGNDGRQGSQIQINEYRDGTLDSNHAIFYNKLRSPVEDPARDDEGWRPATMKELNQIFQNKDDIGNFKTSDTPDENPWPDYYWSCEQTIDEPKEYEGFGGEFIWHVMAKNFKTGEEHPIRKGEQANLRFVYTEKRELKAE